MAARIWRLQVAVLSSGDVPLSGHRRSALRMRVPFFAAAAGAAFIFTAYGSASAAPSPVLRRFNAQRGAMMLRTGKAIPLSGVYSYSGPGRTPSKSANAKANLSGVGGLGVTVVNASVFGPFPANEPAIAADPTNPRHLIASANDYRFGDSNAGLYSSYRDGASFTDSIVQYITR